MLGIIVQLALSWLIIWLVEKGIFVSWVFTQQKNVLMILLSFFDHGYMLYLGFYTSDVVRRTALAMVMQKHFLFIFPLPFIWGGT